MNRTKQQPIVASVPGMGTLNQFVRLLNTTDYWGASLIKDKKKIGGDYRLIRAEMHRLVRAWFRSGPNVSKLLDADPMVAGARPKPPVAFHSNQRWNSATCVSNCPGVFTWD